MRNREQSPQVYVAWWPQHSVVKVGVTVRKRWRTFEIRGAQMVLIVDCDSWRTSDGIESDVHAILRRSLPRAFAAKCELSESLLATHSRGYLECYHTDDVHVVLNVVVGIASAHGIPIGSANGSPIEIALHRQTDQQTDQPTTHSPPRKSLPSVTHTRVQDFGRMVGNAVAARPARATGLHYAQSLEAHHD